MIGIFIGSFNPPTIAHLEICLKLKNEPMAIETLLYMLGFVTEPKIHH